MLVIVGGVEGSGAQTDSSHGKDQEVGDEWMSPVF